MNLDGQPASDAILPANLQALQRLAKLLGVKRGFQLYILVCPDPRERTHLIGRLTRTPELANRINMTVDLAEHGPNTNPPDDVSMLEARLHRDAPPDAIVHLVNGDGWLDAGRLADLNLHRNALAAQVNASLLWWLPEPTVIALARNAPDLWSWRTGVMAFEGSSAPTTLTPAPPPALDWIALSGMSSEAKTARLDALASALPQLESPPIRLALQFERADLLQSLGRMDEALNLLRGDILPATGDLPSERANALLRIADLLAARGELDTALHLLSNEVLPICKRLGQDMGIAITRGKIADIQIARGQLDEALHILTEELIPAFERLGSVRAKAVTQGKIADILMARGQLDEALRIRTEEQLPVFEHLGDIRSKAVTQGKIAEVLMARGQLDEALRIRTEEQLPVFERLGDVREKAATHGKIAEILMARGQLDEALRIHTEVQIPVYEHLGDVRELLACRANQAIILLKRAAPGDRTEARRLLNQALADARQLKLPGEVEAIESWLSGLNDD
jgi:tetratricopeptide (TPR) repeat protein